jgi:DNA-directed RNA polymerase subunit RPC12/RpoP
MFEMLFKCDMCDAELQTAQEDGGKLISCPDCAGQLVVPIMPPVTSPAWPDARSEPLSEVNLTTPYGSVKGPITPEGSKTFWTVLATGMVAVATVVAVGLSGGRGRV